MRYFYFGTAKPVEKFSSIMLKYMLLSRKFFHVFKDKMNGKIDYSVNGNVCTKKLHIIKLRKI